MKIKIYNTEGKEAGEMAVSDSVFDVKRNDDLIHQVFVSILANQRQVLAHTKNRGERAGSGIKPWRQKGTGRARVGSARNPLWKKGGVAFGPRKDRNFEKKINKKMSAQAVKMVLSGKAKDGELVVVNKMELSENKTKVMAKILENLKIKEKVLVSFSEKEKDLRIASRNLVKVFNVLTDQMNVADMLSSKYLLMSKESVTLLDNKYKKEEK